MFNPKKSPIVLFRSSLGDDKLRRLTVDFPFRMSTIRETKPLNTRSIRPFWIRASFVPCFSFVIATFVVAATDGDAPKPKASPAVSKPGDDSKSAAANSTETLDISLDDLASGASANLARELIQRHEVDRATLDRYFPIDQSLARRERLKRFENDWLALLGKVDFNSLELVGKIDYLLLKNQIKTSLRRLDSDAVRIDEIAPYLPFASIIIDLEESRLRMVPLDSEKAAGILSDLPKKIAAARKEIESKLKDMTEGKPEEIARRKAIAARASRYNGELKRALADWFGHYNGYDPVFSWWNQDLYKAADQAIGDYGRFLDEKLVGLKPAAGAESTEADRPRGGRRFGGGGGMRRVSADDPIIGDPIGRSALVDELENEMIPYSPEDLIALAEKQFKWCEGEMIKASRELGYGDDWKKALEHVKQKHVEPGKQPALIRELAEEAIAFIDKNDLVTIPKLARETWRMDMMSPQMQLVNPFFTGGAVISVSYPTNTMTYEQKLMSMRGNNIHFSRATVHHEVIPGHHLQLFMQSRYKPYRRTFSTPFLVEGWALYWELLLWDLNFQRSPEDRIGMLFWRMHRCARIIFSLNFHLGKMTPQQCIDYLVDRVGHERDNATGEVRRSFGGAYSPLYQAAYMLGGFQLKALRRELVDTGKMSNKQFHDAVLREGAIPIEMIRASLTKQELTPDFKTNWKFEGEKPGE
jgi:uncharacterized protein (DUF885 family)